MGYPKEMLAVWEAAPAAARRRSSKDEVLAAWKQLRLDRHTERIIQALGQARQTTDWQRGYVPGLHRWLRWGRWKEFAPATPPPLFLNIANPPKPDDDMKRRIERLKALSPAELAKVKARAVERADPFMQKKLSTADPFGGSVLTVLMSNELEIGGEDANDEPFE